MPDRITLEEFAATIGIDSSKPTRKPTPPIVYVAGPFRARTKAGVARNIERANRFARWADGLGCQVLCPHTMYGDWHGHVDEEHMIEVTKRWLAVCDVMLVCVPQAEAAASAGTMGEIVECGARGIPVFYADQPNGEKLDLCVCRSWDFEAWLTQGRERGADKTTLRRAQHFLVRVSRMLAEKNAAYGNSATDPVRVFSQAEPDEAIRVRIDDKLSRIARGNGSGDEDAVFDLVGYLALLAAIREE